MNQTKYIKTDKNNDSIGLRIRWAREDSGYSQREIAEIMGCDRKRIHYMETGKSPICVSEMLFFCGLFKKPLYYFVQDCVVQK